MYHNEIKLEINSRRNYRNWRELDTEVCLVLTLCDVSSGNETKTARHLTHRAFSPALAFSFFKSACSFMSVHEGPAPTPVGPVAISCVCLQQTWRPALLVCLPLGSLLSAHLVWCPASCRIHFLF